MEVYSELWNFVFTFMLDSPGQKKCHKIKLDIKSFHRNYKAMKAVL